LDYTKYITEQALILIPVLYAIGMMLKNSKLPDWLIPWVLLVLGIAGSIGLMGGLSVQAIIQGVLVTGTTVYANQLYKQTLSGGSTDK
jgi:hypothetical protein